ncbi:hypothetical protein N2152v2_010912 [Parachlorella kessleri]
MNAAVMMRTGLVAQRLVRKADARLSKSLSHARPVARRVHWAPRPQLKQLSTGAAAAAASSRQQAGGDQAWDSNRRSTLASMAGAAALLTAMMAPQPARAERGRGLFGFGSPPQAAPSPPPAAAAATITRDREATMESKEAIPSAVDLSADELATIKLFQDNTPSVVNIANIALARARGFSTDVMKLPQGQGSGFVWDNQGHIVTNFHVIRGAAEVQVTLLDQSVHKAKIVGGDRSKDIAVLQLEAPRAVLENLKPVKLGQSTNLFVGQRVFAIGNPFGLDHSLSSGLISGLNRELMSGGQGPNLKNMVQTDASINPGNSGGPLLDSKGRLIGINTAIADPSGRGSSSGVGFAIPIDTVKGLVDQILTYGRVIRPILGISIAPQQAVRQLGLTGVLVLDAPPGTPAANAGMQGTSRDDFGRLVLGDVIVGLKGRTVKSEKDLFDILDGCKVGETVEVEVLRGGKTKKTLSVTLAERAPDVSE